MRRIRWAQRQSQSHRAQAVSAHEGRIGGTILPAGLAPRLGQIPSMSPLAVMAALHCPPTRLAAAHLTRRTGRTSWLAQPTQASAPRLRQDAAGEQAGAQQRRAAPEQRRRIGGDAEQVARAAQRRLQFAELRVGRDAGHRLAEGQAGVGHHTWKQHRPPGKRRRDGDAAQPSEPGAG